MDARKTVGRKALLAMAEHIEACAEQALEAWMLLGQAEKYDAAMEQARMYRRAAALPSVASRREFLGE